jgi:drug/metabolite transporter (DMT)-like permease
MFGQFCFFSALKHSEASKISGMLGFKIIFLALISIVFMNQHFSLLQWGAVLMAVIATLVFASSDKLDCNFKENLPIMGWVIATCLGYASCDIISAAGIRHLMDETSPLKATLLVVAGQYMILGIGSIYALPKIIRKDKALLKDAIAYSLTWYTGILFLFLSFTLINVVLANIIQSTRGLTSIGIALIVTKLGHTHIESKMTKTTLGKRIVVAILMAFAVILYVLGK